MGWSSGFVSAENFWPQTLHERYPILALSSLLPRDVLSHEAKSNCQHYDRSQHAIKDRGTYILQETAFSWLQNRHVKTVSVAKSAKWKWQRRSVSATRMLSQPTLRNLPRGGGFLAPPGFLLDDFLLPMVIRYQQLCYEPQVRSG